ETAGLWATPQARADWVTVRRLTKGRRTSVLLHQGGGLEVLFPEAFFAEPGSWVYNRGIVTPREIAWKVRQIEGSDAVVTGNVQLRSDEFLARFPEFRAALAGFDAVPAGSDFVVYRRRGRGGTGRVAGGP